jgi:elongation factor P hydroxylase
MENKQTAVEWLVSNSYTFQVEIEAGNEHLKSRIQQAKQMEKEQITEARDNGIKSTIKGYGISSEQYYNETYGKQDIS